MVYLDRVDEVKDPYFIILKTGLSILSRVLLHQGYITNGMHDIHLPCFTLDFQYPDFKPKIPLKNIWFIFYQGQVLYSTTKSAVKICFSFLINFFITEEPLCGSTDDLANQNEFATRWFSRTELQISEKLPGTFFVIIKNYFHSVYDVLSISILILWLCLSVTLSRRNCWTDFDEFRYGDKLDLGEGHMQFFITYNRHTHGRSRSQKLVTGINFFTH